MIMPGKSYSMKREFYYVAALALFLASLIWLRSDPRTFDHPAFYEMGDHLAYHYMATHNIFDFHYAPYCWRIAAPLLAKHLPFDIQTNFFLIAFLGIWLAGITVYYLALSASLPRPYPLTGMLFFFSMGWITHYLFHNFWIVDAWVFFFTALAFLAILNKKDGLFVASLAIGIFFKESILFVAPLYYTFRAKKVFDIRILIRFFMYLIPPLIILISLRFFIPGKNQDASYIHSIWTALGYSEQPSGIYVYSELAKDFIRRRTESCSVHSLHIYTTYPFGVSLVLLNILGFWKNRKLWLKFSPFIFLVYLQLLFAANTERLLVLAFPAVILGALFSLNEISEKYTVDPRAFAILPILLIGLNLRNPLEWSAPFEWQLAVFLVFSAGILLFRKKAKTS